MTGRLVIYRGLHAAGGCESVKPEFNCGLEEFGWADEHRHMRSQSAVRQGGTAREGSVPLPASLPRVGGLYIPAI